MENPTTHDGMTEEQRIALEANRQAMRAEVEKIFDFNPGAERRCQYLAKKVAWMGHAGEEFAHAGKTIVEAGRLTNKEAFVSTVMRAIDPLLHFKVEHPEEYDQLRDRLRERGDETMSAFTDLITHEIDSDGWLRLHVPDNTGKSMLELYGLLQKSLRAIADYLTEHPEVPGVCGTSWIVGDRSGERLIKSLGFRTQPITEEDRIAFFPKELRPIKRAEITREEFLKRYGPKTKTAP